MTLKLLITADIIKTKVCITLLDRDPNCNTADFIYFWDPDKTPAYKIPDRFMDREIYSIDSSINGENLIITLY